MTAALDHLLAAIGGVTNVTPRPAGKGYRTACPVCGSRSLKVSIAEGAEGRLLLHAFCGHSPAEVLAACGLCVTDLFIPRDLRSLAPAERQAMRETMRISHWRAALPVIAEETSIVLLAANQLGDGLSLTDRDRQRVCAAALRLFDAREVLTQ
jgi:hypothetical protein